MKQEEGKDPLKLEQTRGDCERKPQIETKVENRTIEDLGR